MSEKEKRCGNCYYHFVGMGGIWCGYRCDNPITTVKSVCEHWRANK